MKIISLVTILLWTIFLSSCRTQIICTEIKSYAINPVAMYDVSFQFNRCRVRCFDLNNWETLNINQCKELDQYSSFGAITAQEKDGSSFQAINLPLNSCEGVAGFNFKTITNEIRPKIKALASLRSSTCGE